MIFEEFSGTVKIFPSIKIKIFQKSCFFLLTNSWTWGFSLMLILYDYIRLIKCSRMIWYKHIRSSGFRVRWKKHDFWKILILKFGQLKILQKSCFFLLTREPEVLALCLFYTIISVSSNAAEWYNISIWLDPQVSELGGKNMIFEEFSGTVKIFPSIKIKIFQKSCFFHLTRKPEDLMCLYHIILLHLMRRI